MSDKLNNDMDINQSDQETSIFRRGTKLAIWDVYLTNKEVEALRRGASPLMVRPHRLQYYAPLEGPLYQKSL